MRDWTCLCPSVRQVRYCFNILGYGVILSLGPNSKISAFPWNHVFQVLSIPGFVHLWQEDDTEALASERQRLQARPGLTWLARGAGLRRP